jgi:oligopeptide/dipeptide ABC transporter ATP-binding protein
VSDAPHPTAALPSPGGEATVEPLLVIDDVSKVFTPRRGRLGKRAEIAAVSDVTLQIAPGETFGLVGETGSGKSTLGRLAVGLEQPTSGSVVFGGRDLKGLSRGDMKAMRRRVQVVFQDPYESLNPFMTVEQTLEEPLRIHGLYQRETAPAKIAELLDLVGLAANVLPRRTSDFSGGQQQRIAIARALTVEPELLFADEPTAALDVSIQSQILNLLLEIQQVRPMAMLLISHNLLVMRHMSQRMGVMYGGRVVESGPSEAVYRSPSHPYTRALLSAIPIADPVRERARRRIRIEGEAPNPAALPSGCSFHTRCWLADERCGIERPRLRPFGAPGHDVACHHAEQAASPPPPP